MSAFGTQKLCAVRGRSLSLPLRSAHRFSTSGKLFFACSASVSATAGTAPNFSGCVGRTGLDNVICRHEALLKVKPDNPGLTNSLAHLRANLAAHAAKQAAKDAGMHGNSGTHGNSGSHSPSGS